MHGYAADAAAQFYRGQGDREGQSQREREIEEAGEERGTEQSEI